MTKLIILSGAPGAGKSTYAKGLLEHKSLGRILIIESDAIREEMFINPQHTREENVAVFAEIKAQIRANIKKYDTIIYDSTATSIKLRRIDYLEFKKYATVEVHIFIKPLKVLYEQNAGRGRRSVPEHVIRRAFNNLQPPIEGVDCDKAIAVDNIVINPSEVPISDIRKAQTFTQVEMILNRIIPEFKDEIALNRQTHDTPYHLETIDEHIAWTVRESLTVTLKLVAMFHDLGKGVVKDGGRYYGHEKFGALLAFLATQRLGLSDTVYQVVLHHSQAHQGFSNKYIEKFRLNEPIKSLDCTLLELLNEFREIDDNCRIVADNSIK